MSNPRIARSPDLARLRAEGYEVDVRDGHVAVANIPYVTAERVVDRGIMVIAFTEAGDRTGPPPDHTVMWSGSPPCRHDGTPLASVYNSALVQDLGPGLHVEHRFSSKPDSGRYDDYHHQFTSYIALISHEAQALDPKATAATFNPVETREQESVHCYWDTASTRAGISTANAKLELGKVAIVGLGGSGSYVLDLVVKSPIGEIHLFDGDELLNHNAFRAPGAVPLAALCERPKKVDYWAGVYRHLHRHVIARPYDLDGDRCGELDGLDFVFLCMDSGPAKRELVEYMEALGIAFIDVGMGLNEHEGSIGGIVRVTTSTPGHRTAREHIDFSDPDDEANEYARNIQVVELNALAACLSVMRFKKHFGFYRDYEAEHNSLFTVDGNHLLNQETMR
jgi:hypothetical protein